MIINMNGGMGLVLQTQKEAEGKIITLNEPTPPSLKELTVYGKSTQDGTPSPENPVEIISVGDGGSVAVSVFSENFFKYTRIGTKTSNGVTITNNGDGTFTATGTKENATKAIGVNTKLTHAEAVSAFKPGRYKIGGCPSTIWPDLFLDYYLDGVAHYSVIRTSAPNSVFELTQEMLNNDTFYVIYGFYCNTNLAATTPAEYCPFIYRIDAYQTATFTTGLPLRGIPVTSGGNVTIDGQQYIADTLEVHADGTGKVIKRIGETKFDDETIWSKFQDFKYSTDKDFGRYKKDTTVLCDNVPSMYPLDYATKGDGILINWQGRIRIDIGTVEDTTEAVKAIMSGHFILAQLEEEVVFSLTAEEVQAFLAMKTFAPVTNIFNDQGAMEKVTYIGQIAL